MVIISGVPFFRIFTVSYKVLIQSELVDVVSLVLKKFKVTVLADLLNCMGTPPSSVFFRHIFRRRQFSYLLTVPGRQNPPEIGST